MFQYGILDTKNDCWAVVFNLFTTKNISLLFFHLNCYSNDAICHLQIKYTYNWIYNKWTRAYVPGHPRVRYSSLGTTQIFQFGNHCSKGREESMCSFTILWAYFTYIYEGMLSVAQIFIWEILKLFSQKHLWSQKFLPCVPLTVPFYYENINIWIYLCTHVDIQVIHNVRLYKKGGWDFRHYSLFLCTSLLSHWLAQTS
jgi:hypothetical protein